MSTIAELTRTMASELVNQLQNNMQQDLSNNQVEMSFSFVTPALINRNNDDISLNDID